MLKLNGDRIAHKTERGLVRLSLSDTAAIERAAGELLAAATPDDGDVTVLVAPMVKGNRELIVGVVRDPQFGANVMLGLGGVLAEAIADTRKQIANGATVGVEYALTFGEDKPERYAHYFKIMADAAAYAQERGIKLVMKPHGGGSGASEEILNAIKAVGHPNFKIWYDAGNIIGPPQGRYLHRPTV